MAKKQIECNNPKCCKEFSNDPNSSLDPHDGFIRAAVKDNEILNIFCSEDCMFQCVIPDNSIVYLTAKNKEDAQNLNGIKSLMYRCFSLK